MNPLIDTLPAEILLLERGNATFNCDTGGLRHVRRIEDSLTAPARHVLRDFLRANRDAEEPIRARDATVEHLVVAARAAYESLKRSEAFCKAVRALAEPHSGAAAPAPDGLPDAPHVEFDPDQLVRAFGEFVVNGRGEMTQFETTFAPLWNRERERMLSHRAGDSFVRLGGATKALLDQDNRLLRWLQDKSFEICERFDVAAAPLGGGR